MVSNQKGLTVELRTLKKYDNRAVLGRKIEEIGGKKMMMLVWCKLFTQHKASILLNLLCKGGATAAVET